MIRVMPLILLLAASLLSAGLLYWPGISGAFNFDDFAALAPLNNVRGVDGTLEYVLGGTAGPSGRPIALLSFLLQREYWPSNAEPFLAANVAFHLLNGALVTLICAQLLRWRFPTAKHLYAAAAFAGSFWLLMPLHAATTLIIVQRMALLSASIMLSGVSLYIAGRRRLANGERYGFSMMTIAVVIFTALAVLAKENGALLPALLLVLEITLLSERQPPSRAAFLWWRRIFLLLPTAAVFGYLILHLPVFSDAYALRPFTFYERIATQALVLLKYVKLILAPQPLAITPYYDDFPAIGDVYHPLLGPALIGFWIALSGAAYWLRRRTPWVSFCILWFLVGHLLESTTLPLEQVFLHRNYIPAVAIAILSGALVLRLSRSTVKGALTAGILFLAVHGGSLYATVAIWKEPRLAAELWVLERPSSIRASEALEDYYRAEHDAITADKLVRERFALNPDNTGAAIDWLATHCSEQDATLVESVNQKIIGTLGTSYVSNATFQKIDRLFSSISEEKCPAIGYASIEHMLDSLASNAYVERSPLHRHNLLLIRFRKHFVDRNFYGAVTALEQAYALTGDLSTLRLLCETLSSGGLQAQAAELVQQARPPATGDPRQLWIWERKILDLREKYSGAN